MDSTDNQPPVIPEHHHLPESAKITGLWQMSE